MSNRNDLAQNDSTPQIVPSGNFLATTNHRQSRATMTSGDDSHLRTFAHRLARHCAAFKGADAKRSTLQLVATIVPFLGLLTAMYATIDVSYWVTLLLAVPTAGLLVRLFIIQHDCGHGSFFKTRIVNDMIGRMMSVFTLTPYGHWKQHHALHHATSGNLDKRVFGDIHTLTVREYAELPALGSREAGYSLVTVLGSCAIRPSNVAAIAPDVVFIDLETPNRDRLESVLQMARSVERPIAILRRVGMNNNRKIAEIAQSR